MPKPGPGDKTKEWSLGQELSGSLGDLGILLPYVLAVNLDEDKEQNLLIIVVVVLTLVVNPGVAFLTGLMLSWGHKKLNRLKD